MTLNRFPQPGQCFIHCIPWEVKGKESEATGTNFIALPGRSIVLNPLFKLSKQAMATKFIAFHLANHFPKRAKVT